MGFGACASFLAAAGFLGCSSGEGSAPSAEPQAEAVAAAKAARSPHVPGESGQQFLDRATPAERDRFFDEIRQGVTLHPPKPEDTQLDFYVCEAYIGTYQFLFDPKLSDGGCKYPSAQYFPHADAGPGGCGEYVTEPSLVFWVPIINIHGTAPATVPACTAGLLSDGGLGAGLNNFWVQLPVPKNIGGDMIAALSQEGFPFPSIDWNGNVTSFRMTSSMTSGASDAGSGFLQFQDIASLYVEQFGGTGIPIPTQYVDGGNNLTINMPAGSNGIAIPQELPIFQAGDVVGDTMSYWAGTIVAQVDLEPDFFGAEAPQTTVTCSPVGNVTGWNEKPISTSTIVATGSTCGDGGTVCPAAAALAPLGAPLEACAANSCCQLLTNCVADNSQPSSCADLAACFVNCEATVIGAAGGDAAAGTADIFPCLDGCSCSGSNCATYGGSGTPNCSFTAGGVTVSAGSAVPGSPGGCLASSGSAVSSFEAALTCVQTAGCTNLPAAADAGTDSGADAGPFAEFPVPTSTASPVAIVTGPDQNLWFTEMNGNKIGKITTSGAITEYPIPTPSSLPQGIAAGPDGNVWFTEANSYKVAKITPAGTITEYQLATFGSAPLGITAGPDGNVWFVESNNNAIGQITPSGTITEYAIPTSSSVPFGITAGSDGALWFTELSGNKLGRITTSGSFTEYTIPTSSAGARQIASGPDGEVWFVENSANKIAAWSPTYSQWSEYPIPTPNSLLDGVAAGPDGNVWFSEGGGNKIGRVTPAGTITEYAIPTSGTSPAWIAAGPDGNMWFTQLGSDQIGRYSIAPLGPTATAVAVGQEHVCALTSAAGVACWGDDSQGQLGNGATTLNPFSAPAPVLGLSSGVSAITAGAAHTCALLSGGTVDCWGANNDGQLGTGSAGSSPAAVSGLSGVSAIAAGAYFTCALASGGVQCWGDNTYGELGNGGSSGSNVPVAVSGLSSGVTSIIAGAWHACALTATGAVECWGLNQYGELGDGTQNNSNVPVAVSGLSSPSSLAGGWYDTYAVADGGAVLAWGGNFFGELGNGTSNTGGNLVPGPVSNLTSGVASVSGGIYFGCGLLSGGSIECWGDDSEGQLGNGATNSSDVPVTVAGLSNVRALSVGFGSQACALTSAGGIACWGANYSGQLGIGTVTITTSDVPVNVAGFTPP
jgi:streptogramin lyase